MRIKQLPIDDIIPYARNPRKNDVAVQKVATSIHEFGFRQPIVVDEDHVIICGHTRHKAALSLGLSKVPVHVATGLTKAQVQAYRLADNRAGQESSWDDDLLKFELSDLNDLNFDLSLMGFDESEIAHALSSQSGKEDIVPDPPDDPITKTGDLYLLGNHRLLCGDATAGGDVQRLLDSIVPLLMVTDPPYGVDYNPEWRTKTKGLWTSGKPVASGKVKNDDRLDWRQAWVLFPGDVAYIWHADRHASEVQSSIEAAGFEIRCQIIWAKPRFIIGRGDYHWQHEPCWYAVKEKKAGHYCGDRKQSTLWEIPHTKSDTGHGTQKPVECMRRPIINNSSPGQAVYDPFLGSGTTMIAAETEGRVCYGMEIDPIYCDVIVKRWEEFTGERATCEKAENQNPLN